MNGGWTDNERQESILWKTSKAKEIWIFTWATEAKIGIPPKAKTID